MQALNPRSFKPPHERFGMGLERLEKVGWRQVGLGDVVSEPSTLKLKFSIRHKTLNPNAEP